VTIHLTSSPVVLPCRSLVARRFCPLVHQGLAAALSGPFTAEAKKGRKKDKKKCPECPAQIEPVDLCPTQVAPCTAIMTIDCGNQPICDDIIPCCSFLGTCDISGFFTCLANA
jgi:hypothetical protein